MLGEVLAPFVMSQKADAHSKGGQAKKVKDHSHSMELMDRLATHVTVTVTLVE